MTYNLQFTDKNDKAIPGQFRKMSEINIDNKGNNKEVRK